MRKQSLAEPDIPIPQSLTINQEVRFILANTTGHLHLLHVRFKWNEERRTLQYHRYVLGASRKVSDSPLHHLELGSPGLGHFLFHGTFAAAGDHEFVVSLNDRLEEVWRLPFEWVRAVVTEKTERVMALSQLKGANVPSGAGKPKLISEGKGQ
jgi:hypothetical protein